MGERRKKERGNVKKEREDLRNCKKERKVRKKKE